MVCYHQNQYYKYIMSAISPIFMMINLKCIHSMNDTKILAPAKYKLPLSILQVFKVLI